MKYDSVNFMKFLKNYPGLVILGLFFLYIAVITFLYPLMDDDLCFSINNSIPDLFNNYWQSYLHWNPRLGILLAMIFAILPKIIFNILNPVVQIVNIILIFYLILFRFPKKQNNKDAIYLFLISSMYLLFTAQPGQSIIWLTGSIINSWMMLLWLLLLGLILP